MPHKHLPIAAFAGAILSVLGGALAAFAQTTGPRNPPLIIRSVAGRDLFEFYCATCHGRDGKGSGPAAAALKTPPPDLTRLARRNAGTFPRQRVEAFVTNGGDVLTPAHGSSAMPVWGPVFRSLDSSDTMVKIRIANVVEYIESMQAK
jgi:mono/diheme cytochrome c family protein